MKRAVKALASGLSLMFLVGLILTLNRCQQAAEVDSPLPERPATSADQPPPRAKPATPDSPASSVMVYIKMVVEKEFNFIARTVGGKQDHTWERVNYDAANAWWDNPLIVYADPPMSNPDVIGRAAGEVITGHGASSNLSVQVTLIPNAEVSVRTMPPSDGIRGTITTRITTVAEYYDGQWTEMVRERDRPITFHFDTLTPGRPVEEIGRETRTIPPFVFERYTREELRWEPRSKWPDQPTSGDWRVVVHGANATSKITSYRYTDTPAAE